LVHEDLPDGLRAKQALDSLVHHLNVKTEIAVNLWKFSLLRDPDLQREAVHSATQANVVFLSPGRNRELPVPVRCWLQDWSKRHEKRPCALVVSLDAGLQDSAPAHSLLDYVRAVAGPMGVEVFPHYGATPQAAWDWSVHGLQHRAGAATRVMEDILQAHEARPRWGINE
jgi:hypothetical protein